MPRFIVIGHHSDDSDYAHPYPSMDAAVIGEMDTPLEYSVVFEIGETVHGYYAMNVTEDFIQAWIAKQELSITENNTHKSDREIKHLHQLYAHGPKIRKPSKRNKPQLIAAE